VITFSGVGAAKERVGRVMDAIHDRVEGVLQMWATAVITDMQADHPYEDRTGELTGSIGFDIIEFGGGPVALAVLFANAAYAEYVEYGTSHARPYPFFWPMIYKHLPDLEVELQEAIVIAMETQ
jgi:hypothetical protein